MRGRRLPEIAAGAFTEYVKLTLESMKAKLVVDLPRDISAERRAGLVAEFERAGAMLLFTFTLKTSSLAVPPGLLFKCGHHNDVLARDALLKCLASSSSHEQILELQQPPLRNEAEAWLAGESLDALPVLAAFIACKKFGWSCEYAVEGLHAKIERGAGNVTARREAYNSLLLRLPWFKEMLQRCPAKKDELADALYRARNPKQLLAELGFSSHPVWVQADQDRTHAWDPVFRDIMYQADLYARFIASPPTIKMVSAGGVASAPERPVVHAGSVADTFWRLAAIEHMCIVLRSLSGSGPHIFSCPAPEHSVACLQAVMSTEGGELAAACVEAAEVAVSGSSIAFDWLDAKRGKQMFVSVSVAHPKAAKKVEEGNLVEADIGIGVHAVRHVGYERVCVGTTPVNIELSGAPGKDLQALVLSLDSFTLEQLGGWRRFDKNRLIHMIETRGFVEAPPPAEASFDDQVAVVEYVAGISGAALRTNGSAAFSAWLDDRDLIKRDVTQSRHFTDDAQRLFRMCWDLK